MKRLLQFTVKLTSGAAKLVASPGGDTGIGGEKRKISLRRGSLRGKSSLREERFVCASWQGDTQTNRELRCIVF